MQYHNNNNYNNYNNNNNLLKHSQSQFINYENKENQQQYYSTPVRSNSNGSINQPLSPLSPSDKMVLSPNEKMVLSPKQQHHHRVNKSPKSPLSPKQQQQHHHRVNKSPKSPDDKMVLSPPKNNNNNTLSQPISFFNHGLMGPPQSIPLKRPTSNLFEYVSRQTSTQNQNNSIMINNNENINILTTPTIYTSEINDDNNDNINNNNNNNNNNNTFIPPSLPTFSSSSSLSSVSSISSTSSTTTTFSFPVPQQRNKTLNRSSIQIIKNFSKNGETQEDQFQTRKREDRKSSQLLRQSSKRDMLIYNSRIQNLNNTQQQQQQQTKSPPKPTPEQLLIIEQENKIRAKKRIESIKEVYSSESNYMGHLNNIIDSYLLPLRRENTAPEEVKFIVSIFSNIESIRQVNKVILERFKERIVASQLNENTIISDLFFEMIPLLSSYTEYYINYYRSLHNIDSWFNKCKKFKKFLDQDPMILKSLLIMPCQRIPRYSLLIDSILRFTLPTHQDYDNLRLALDKMKSITEIINEKVRESENLQKITNIRYKFNDQVGFLDEVHRRLIKDSNNTLQLQPFKSIHMYNNINSIYNCSDNNSNKEEEDLTDEEEYSSLNSSFKKSLSSANLKKTFSKKLTTLIPSDCVLYLFNDTLLLGTIKYNNQLNNNNNEQNNNNNNNIINNNGSNNNNNYNNDNQNNNNQNTNNNNNNNSNVKYNVVLKANLIETFIKDYPILAPNVFSIHHNSGTWLISAQNKEQREEWVKDINDTIDKLIHSDSDLEIRRNKISLKGSDDYGWYAFDSESPANQDSTLISRSLQELEKNQIFTPKKRKSSIVSNLKQRFSALSPHKNQNVKRNSSFVLNSLYDNE